MGYHKRLKLVQGYRVTEHPLYGTWNNMKARCYNNNIPGFENYGGRGIKVCPKWKDSFEAFALDMGLPPTTKHTLERKDNNRMYHPKNCIWATRTEQCLNRRVFKNNKLGETGIHKIKDAYMCRCYKDGERYNLGRFETIEKAKAFRDEFSKLFDVDKQAALVMIQRRARLDSVTGIKGITKNEDGYLVRVTLLDGSRKYLGFSKTLDAAIEKLNSFKGKYK